MKSSLMSAILVGGWVAIAPIASHAQSSLPPFVQFQEVSKNPDPYAGIHEVGPQPSLTPLSTRTSNGIANTPTQPVDGRFTFNPITVYIPYSESTGSSTVDWYWNETDSYFRFGCLYIVVDNISPEAQGKVTECETQGSYSVTLPWIQIGHIYTAYLQAQDTPYQENRGTPQSAVFFNPGSSVVIRAQLPVNISVSPNPATIPSGATSTTVTINWNNLDPNNQRVSWYGTNSAPPYNGQTLCLGQPASPAGATTAKVVSGQRSTLYVVPYDGCVAGTVVSSVPHPILNQVSFYTTN
ncbi:hypothetical protein [Dyella acidisoli]|uniref:Ig-like domain-containing protein n=1 Tax=Dyella acidisoli TaxID=1867834 RepID=A0ABQ5XJ45_9GAMM|nr:hypothetical protein [Dyella acidisoli]GLQ91683.1 hypothetical protein GCM10007901_06330 [Dyella acidisoli]